MQAIRTGATFSEDRSYRYQLSRMWGEGTRATFIMLNPSTADENVDDRTIKRCISFAMSWGLDGLDVVNLYAFRATDPNDLWNTVDPIGPENDRYLREAGLSEGPLIAAWSTLAKASRVGEVRAFPGFDRLMCLAENKDGSPRHPLYANNALSAKPWRHTPLRERT